jgi:hypothetical protein
LADARDKRVLELCHRVEALEAALMTHHRQAPPTPPRSASRLARACLALLVLSTGWVMAQSPAPGQLQSIDPGETAVIRKGPDGITRVSGPFQVEDAGGKVILSVGAADNTAAATSIALANGGGRLITYSSSGSAASIVGSQAGGWGMFVAADTSGRHRALVLGDTGAHMTLNEAGKQVALSGSFNGKGVIGIYSDRSQRLAVLAEAQGGGGELTIHDKGHAKVALLGGNAAGGLLQINAPGKTAAAVDLSVEGATGAGYVTVMDGGGKRTGVLAGASAEGAGGLVIERDGQMRASVSLNDAGAGQLVLANPQGGPGLTANGTLESGGRGAGLQVFNGDGEQVIGIGSRDDGSGTVNVQDKGKLLVAMQRGEDGEGGQLRVNNAEGRAAVQATGLAEGGALAVSNKSGDPVATIDTAADKGRVTIAESDKAVAELTANAAGAGRLVLSSREGKEGVEASAGDGGAVIVSNKTGDPVAALLTSGADKGAVSILQEGRTVAEVTATAEGTGYMYVADAAGNITLDVDGGPGELTALKKDQVLATFGASADGHGRIAVHGKAGPVAEVRESGEAGVISVRSAKNVPVAGIIGNAVGGGAVVAANASGAVLTQMGATSDGRGEIKVLDAGGALLAAMAKSPDSAGGAVEVYNGKVAVVNIRPGKAGGGYIQLLDTGGRSMVEAGSGSEGVGVVRAGPNYKCGSNYLGLKVPDCIVGLK